MTDQRSADGPGLAAADDAGRGPSRIQPMFSLQTNSPSITVTA